jgi:cytochrome c
MMIRAISPFLLLPLVGVLAGCGGSAPPADSAASTSEAAPAAAPTNFTEQVELGGKLFAAKCANCHGTSGQGTTNAPRVVGLADGALPLDPPSSAKYRKEQFKTVADVAGFVVKSMPPKAPGSLSEEEYFSILAFDLKANGIDLGEKKLDGALAQTLEIPRK